MIRTARVIGRLKCLLISHEYEVTHENILDGGDYVEVTTECVRCSDSNEHLPEYNAVERSEGTDAE